MAEGTGTSPSSSSPRSARAGSIRSPPRPGVSHKCLVPIGGRPLLAHVLEAFAGLEGIDERPHRGRARRGRRAEPDRARPRACRSRFVAAADNIADSVYAAAAGSEGPLVITTADNVLLTPAAVRAGRGAARRRRRHGGRARPQGGRALRPSARASAASTGSATANFPTATSTASRTAGLELAETFREGGQFAKNPMRIARAFGFLNLLILRYGLISLDARDEAARPPLRRPRLGPGARRRRPCDRRRQPAHLRDRRRASRQARRLRLIRGRTRKGRAMAEFTLPKNSRIKEGPRASRRPAGADADQDASRSTATIPTAARIPRYDTFEVDLDSCGPMVLDALIKIKSRAGPDASPSAAPAARGFAAPAR